MWVSIMASAVVDLIDGTGVRTEDRNVPWLNTAAGNGFANLLDSEIEYLEFMSLGSDLRDRGKVLFRRID